MKKITIIGGGASGTLVAVNLLKHAGELPLELMLVERRSRVGRGVAFGTTRPTHLLNVPAGRMGAHPDDVEHFHRWLGEQGHNYGPNDFVPRLLFGEYLRSVFEDAVNGASPTVRFEHVDDEAVDLSINDDSADVMLASGEILRSHHVVLAFGNFQPPQPNVADRSFTSAQKYFVDPWSSRLYETILPDDSLFIIGTGLSMVDVALHLHQTGHRGKITAISTRGLLPERHELGHNTYPSFYAELEGMTKITDVLKCIRRHIKKAESKGGNWRGVIDSLRPVTQKMWLDLPLVEKRLFLQHLSRYWNVARHRMPAEVAGILDEMQTSEQLEILKGRLSEIRFENEKFEITYSSLGSWHTSTADILVNCIGSEPNFSRIENTFIKNLYSRSHIRNDDLGFGIAATPDGEVIGRSGKPSGIIHTLGTALKGTLWETTAIPEIRTQARQLALRLIAS